MTFLDLVLAGFISPPAARGAKVDERQVRHVIRAPSAEFPTLSSALKKAHANVEAGLPTKVLIAPGTYRESVLGLDWRRGRAGETPLVLEGQGQVIWSAADVYPLVDWQRSGAMLRHPWPYRWGNFGYSWSAKGLIGHRSEMAFINGRSLRPRVLERYAIDGIVQDPARGGEVAYRYLDTRPAESVLKPGEFGIVERSDGPPEIVVYPPVGVSLGPDSIEVSVRRNLLDLRGKSNVVLRNLTFFGTANDDGDFGASNAVRFSIAEGMRSHDVLWDRCRVLWSAQTGLHIDGDNWTVRDSEFSFNGGSGIAGGKSQNILWERNRTNFNVWRLWRAGELGYYTGGFKMHEATRHTIRGHESIGNCTMGAWWDVHCRDVRVQDLVAIGNAANLQFELCEGPFTANRILLAGGKAGDGQLRMWEHGNTSLTRSILYSNYRGSGTTGLYNLRWFGRTDPHAAMAKITAGTNFARDNVFVAGPNVPNFGMIDDIRGPEWSAREPMRYIGERNVFWNPAVPSFASRWIKDGDRTGELAARAMAVNDWLRPPTYLERNARQVDPMLRDPARHDYRFAPGSPLYSERARYPQFHLSDAGRKEWAWFTEWSGYHPDRWNEPPIE